MTEVPFTPCPACHGTGGVASGELAEQARLVAQLDECWAVLAALRGRTADNADERAITALLKRHGCL